MKKKKNFWPLIYGALLTGYATYSLMDTFVIPHDVINVSTTAQANVTSSTSSTVLKELTADTASDKNDTSVSSNTSGDTSTTPTITKAENGYIYQSDSVTITLTETVYENSTVYVADVEITDSSYLQSGLAKGQLGRNIKEKTSEIAEEVNAILAINGDYYGFRDSGYVVRNGYLYRDTVSSDDAEDLVVYSDGSMEVIKEGDVTAEELVDKGAVQVYSFGPALLENGEISVIENQEVGQAMTSNPRTAIGYYSPTHYCFVVSDGRTSESEGLSLYQLANFMKDLGCEMAYNLDGGGSSTMYFNGEVVNKPTTNGRKISERSVSDIVYIAQ